MKKLRLDLDALQVETFGTGGAGPVGTVHGRYTGVLEPSCAICVEASDEDTCAAGGAPSIATCNGMGSCPKSACGPTCGPTMVNSCISCTCYASGCVTC